MEHRSMVDGFGPGFIPPNSTLLPSPIESPRTTMILSRTTKLPTNRSHGLMNHAPPQFLSKTVSVSLILSCIELSQLACLILSDCHH
ncbi:hypothetical protein PAHAL_9G593900 [Panicum hallii]|uniref:Uncharacterized protein n=1 Tax=Panicum hallii TaxID=206008 RepID=A0A2S3ITZ6_9POAL|nr:hypothetical protein PAHAL_9G593900 [Panicum hallii]